MWRPVGRGRPQRRVPREGQPRLGDAAPAAVVLSRFTLAVFDLDGTLLDSDVALAAPYVALGVPASEVTFGHVVADECRRLGLDVDDYLDRYDVTAAQPFAGADDLVHGLRRWAVCSNKVRRFGLAELQRLGWSPEVALFAEDFGGGPKRVAPALDALGIADPGAVVFVGDTDHDRAAAAEAGTAFALAAWNRRAVALARPGDLVLEHPTDLLALLEL